MPVAVELIAHLLQNSLKLDAVDSPFAQRFLSSIDDQIGPAFGAFREATSRSELLAAERHFGRVLEVLGDGSVDLGFELQHDAGVFNGVNKLLNGADIFSGQGGGSGRGERVSDIFSGQGGGSGRGGLVADIFSGQGGGSGRGLTAADIFSGQGGGSGTPAAEFGAFNLDLLNAGADLRKLGGDLAGISHARSPEALRAFESAFHRDATNATDDFVAMGQDAQDLARLFGGANGEDDALIALLNVSAKATKLGADFSAVADIFSGQGGGSGFQAMQDDFLKFDSALQHTSGPLAGMLVPAVHPVT